MESLKPQDVLVVLKLCAIAATAKSDTAKSSPLAMATLGIQLGLSASEVHAAVRRARLSGLLHHEPSRPKRRLEGSDAHVFRFRPLRSERLNAAAIHEFLVHGLKYVFPAQRGEFTRGLPTSYAAAPLSALITKGHDPIPVWPFAEGTARGVAFEPLYRTVPFAALGDPVLYELLAIADALREGRARERKIAAAQLCKRLDKIHVG